MRQCGIENLLDLPPTFGVHVLARLNIARACTSGRILADIAACASAQEAALHEGFLTARYFTLPLAFEPQGARHLARGSQYTIALEAAGVRIGLPAGVISLELTGGRAVEATTGQAHPRRCEMTWEGCFPACCACP